MTEKKKDKGKKNNKNKLMMLQGIAGISENYHNFVVLEKNVTKCNKMVTKW